MSQHDPPSLPNEEISNPSSDPVNHGVSLNEFLEAAQEIVPIVVRRLRVPQSYAEDLTHDIYLRLMERWYDRLRDRASMRGFLYRLALLHAIGFQARYLSATGYRGRSSSITTCDGLPGECTVHHDPRICRRNNHILNTMYPQLRSAMTKGKGWTTVASQHMGQGSSSKGLQIRPFTATSSDPRTHLKPGILQLLSLCEQDGMEDPSQNLELKDLKERLLHLAEKWPKKRRQVLLLLLEGNSLEEISNAMGYDSQATKGYWTVRWHLKNIQQIIDGYLQRGLL